MIHVRPFQEGDTSALWAILEPTIRSGETYALPRDMPEAIAIPYWTRDGRSAFVAIADDGQMAGTYYLRANHQGGGAQVANCGYMVAPAFAGQGVAGLLCEHSLVEARQRGFKAMQFNLVVSTNERAVSLWRKHGFETVYRLPNAFSHPRFGLVDAFVMYRLL